MNTIIITAVVTLVAFQFIIFLILLANKLDNEIVQMLLCGVWTLFGLLFIRGGYVLYKKIKLIWFNRNYSYCTFHNKKENKSSGVYVRNHENNGLLNYDHSKDYYVEFDFEHKAKNLGGINIKKNDNWLIISDLFNPQMVGQKTISRNL